MIAIFGAGIAGLTCALELVKKGFKVKIYEKDDTAGGMAKTKRINGIPSEHSWRGFFRFYDNIFDILKQIPITPTDKIYTVEEVAKHNTENDAWVIYKDTIYDITKFIKEHPGGKIIIKALGKDLTKVWKENNVEWHMNHIDLNNIPSIKKIGKLNTTKFTAYDNLHHNMDTVIYNNKPTQKNDSELIFNNLSLLHDLIVFSFSNSRTEKYYNIKMIDYFDINKSKYSYDYFANMAAGPGLGLDKNTCSIGLIFHFYILNLSSDSKLKSWAVMKKPTSEAFIDPLVELLKSKGVEFIFNSELIKINYENNKIINCVVKNNKKEEIITADNYILSINPNNCYEIFNESKMDKLAVQHLELSTVNNQLSFRLGLSQKIKFKQINNGRVLVDSNYNITFYAQEDIFDNFSNDKIKSLWSGTCCQTYNNNALTLNKNDLIEEIIKQILECEELQNEIYKMNGFTITREHIIYTEIWEDWFWTGKQLESKNPKWVNTVNNEKYKPSQITEYDNLYLNGAHTKTSFNIWSMESSCESGKIVANHILEKNKIKKCKIFYHDKLPIFKILEPFDDILYKLNLPSIVDLMVLLLIYYLFQKFKNQKK
jgi:uncharacterized protein with NAD-binding domain and iron-sulfur cluster